VNWALFEQWDRLRRIQGAALDAAGLGPVETPYRVVHQAPGVALRAYGDTARPGPCVLIVPAPIKRPYIWDLAPEVSAVRRCMAAGLPVFLMDWQPAGSGLGLRDYAERLILGCLEAAGAGPAILFGHSLGGLFATVFASLHPQRVRGLALLATPLHFGTDAGVLSAMAADIDPDTLPASVPGCFLNAAVFRVAPGTFGWERWSDALLSLGEIDSARTHAQVERWTLDEFALPRTLFADILTQLLNEDRFARETLALDGRAALPSAVTAPVLCVVDPHCRLVPPASVLPVLERTASSQRTVLEYTVELGVTLQHVGPLVGRRAHASLWPQIVRWIGENSH
jgi:polyhydroxyalkanoate synthase subunit PhaC